jgi:hypothetical protein
MPLDILVNSSATIANLTGQIPVAAQSTITITTDTYFQFAIVMLAIGFAAGASGMYGFLRSYRKAKAKSETEKMRRELIKNFPDYVQYFTQLDPGTVKTKYDDLIDIKPK